MNPINPFLPKQPDTPPPAREEAPKPSEPEDDIRKIGDGILDAFKGVADRLEEFKDLIRKSQKDVDDAVETVDEIGKIFQSTGRGARGLPGDPLVTISNVRAFNQQTGEWETIEDQESREPPYAPSAPEVPIEQPSTEDVANLVVAILNSQSEAQDEEEAEISKPGDESDQWPPWAPAASAAAAVAAVVYGTRKKG